jgi:photosystem II stability/assembly factor-like uncharacterized protein
MLWMLSGPAGGAAQGDWQPARWTQLPVGRDIIHALGFDPNTPGRLYALANETGTTRTDIFRSDDGGATWWMPGRREGSAFVAGIGVDTVGTVYVPDALSGVFESQDGGVQWERVADRLRGATVLVVLPTSPATLYVAGAAGRFFRSRDGAESW